jgi:hypothetical protein
MVVMHKKSPLTFKGLILVKSAQSGNQAQNYRL